MSTPAMRATCAAYPCRCLCLAFSQITRTAPWRLIILQRSHIFLTEALTFIAVLPSFLPWLCESLEDASPTGVGGAEFNVDPVTREDADGLEARLTGRMA